MKDNNKLKELDIDINDITDCAIEALATALAINKSLVKLSVSHNHVSGEAAIALLQVLRSNDTLQKLGISAGYHQAVWDKSARNQHKEKKSMNTREANSWLLSTGFSLLNVVIFILPHMFLFYCFDNDNGKG